VINKISPPMRQNELTVVMFLTISGDLETTVNAAGIKFRFSDVKLA